MIVVVTAFVAVSAGVIVKGPVGSRGAVAPAEARVLGTTLVKVDPGATPTTTPIASPPGPATPPLSAPPLSAPPVAATGDARLDALLLTLPSVLFDGGARMRFGYNPADCCHAGGYNPASNDVWVSERALGGPGRLTYVTVHELAHSVHLESGRGPALTAAVAGAPVVRAGMWDASEQVADCVAWALFPAETAASGITYWSCPEPWRAQVRLALE